MPWSRPRQTRVAHSAVMSKHGGFSYSLFAVAMCPGRWGKFSMISRARAGAYAQGRRGARHFRHDTGNEPARQAHLDDRNQYDSWVEGDEGSTQAFNVCMGSFIGSQRTMGAASTPLPHSIFHHGIRRRGGTIFTAALLLAGVQAEVRTHLIHRPARGIFHPDSSYPPVLLGPPPRPGAK
jgi:hypothetical protein